MVVTSIYSYTAFEKFLMSAGAAAPLWVPVVFLAFAIGRRRFTLVHSAAFVGAEALAVWVHLKYFSWG